MSVGELESARPEPAAGVEITFPRPDDVGLPPVDGDLSRLWRALGIVVVVGCSLVVLWALHPALLLRDTTPSGGDMGAHVWFPAYLRDHLLPHLRIAGWTNDWFGGFPAGQFYFPLPALLVVALDVVLPYNVAFKLVTVLGPLTLPAAAYALGRGLRVRRPGPELFAVAVTMMLFFKGVGAAAGSHAADIQYNQRIMGGTLVSVLAGEFSFSIALSFALFGLGALAYSLRTRRRLWLPAVLLAAAVLSHIVVGIFAIVAALAVLLIRGPLRRIHVAIAIGAVAAALTAFWSVPLLATFSYTASMRYAKLTWYVDYLFKYAPESSWLFVLALIGVAVAVVRRDRAVLTLAAIALVFIAVFRFWPELHAWNLRFLPFWYLMVFLLAAAGTAEVVRAAGHRLARAWIGAPPRVDEPWHFDVVGEGRRFRVVRSVTVVTLVALLAVGAVGRAYFERDFLDFWAQWNYSGFQDTSASSTKPKSWPEYHQLMDTMNALPPGPAIWEGGGTDIDNYGTPLALMLLPYWTHGRVGSMEGLYYESSASLPYVFMAIAPLSGAGNASNPVRGLDYRSISDFALGVRYARELGVRYYLAHSDDAKAHADADPGLRLVKTLPDRDGIPPSGWKIYEVRDHAAVAPLQYQPVVVTPKAGTQSQCFDRPRVPGASDPQLGSWECTAVRWWNTPDAIDHPFAAGGPEQWSRVSADDVARAPHRRLPDVEVSKVHTDDESVSFHVSRTGVPVVVRTSYFPNWEAQGAHGPWRLSPNLMVVVPTSHDVRLHYARSGAEWLGIAATIAGLVALAGLVWWGRRTGGEPTDPVAPVAPPAERSPPRTPE